MIMTSLLLLVVFLMIIVIFCFVVIQTTRLFDIHSIYTQCRGGAMVFIVEPYSSRTIHLYT